MTPLTHQVGLWLPVAAVADGFSTHPNAMTSVSDSSQAIDRLCPDFLANTISRCSRQMSINCWVESKLLYSSMALMVSEDTIFDMTKFSKQQWAGDPLIPSPCT